MNQNAPILLDYLAEESRDNFEQVKQALKDNDCQFEINPYLVRGLDYYTDTVFEITSDNLGSQDAICGGGRYDLLAQEFGGPATPAVGFASGIERLLMVMEAQDLVPDQGSALDVYLCLLGDKVMEEGMVWLQKLRSGGFVADRDYQARGLKAQMRDANKQNTKFVLILGENELQNNYFSVKDMREGNQAEIGFDEIFSYLKEHLKK